MDFILEKRGCDFFAGDAIRNLSDVGNYRVGIYEYIVTGKASGRRYIVEFHHGQKRNVRTVNKRTGKPLKKPVVSIVNENALWIDTQFEEPRDGFLGCFRDLALEKAVHALDLSYTMDGIKAALAFITGEACNVCFSD